MKMNFACHITLPSSCAAQAEVFATTHQRCAAGLSSATLAVNANKTSTEQIRQHNTG